MMNKKYIIKNCPACLPMTKLCDSENMTKVGMYCWDCTDCLLKQVVELGKLVQDKQFIKGSWKFRSPSKARLGREILQLFEIEECE